MDLLGQQITVSLVVSLLISGVLAIATFAVGIRVGKERSDRATMRALYKGLFDHFTELRRRMANGEPRQWSDFALKNDRYAPAMVELELTGDINLLPKHIATRLTALERDTLTFGANIHYALASEVADALQRRLSEVDPTPSTSQSPSTSLSVGSLAFRSNESFDSFCRYVRNNESLRGVGFGGETPDAKLWTRFISFDKVQRDQVGILLGDLRVLCHTVIGADAMAAYHAKDRDIELTLDILAARIRDPHPFAETVLSLGRDVFDQSAK